ncbi:MAG: hypothetical protein RL745_456 [Actinomycetota bacterium]
MPLAARTTLRVGGTPRAELVIDSVADCDQLLPDLFRSQQRWCVMGAGSNIVAADGPLDITVVLMRSHELDARESDDAAIVTVDAGAQWDELVDLAVSRGWSGIEALSGIPGSVGATPIQNVGAYGAQVADVISEVEVFDSTTMSRRWLAAADCGFGYRSSIFKSSPTTFVVTRVRMQLRKSHVSAPVGYEQLSQTLGIAAGDSAPLAEVRTAVMALRRSKGMVLDPADHDTWSVGSYFTNPVVEGDSDAIARIGEEVPHWRQPDWRIKVSAAWLIEAAGFPRGYAINGSGVSISSKHSLSLTNRGAGTAAQVRQLEGAIVDGVQGRFGIRLQREPMLLGFAD